MKTITIQNGTDAPQIINIPDGAKVIIEDGLTMVEPEKYIPKVGDCVKSYHPEERNLKTFFYCIGFDKCDDPITGKHYISRENKVTENQNIEEGFLKNTLIFEQITPDELQSEFNKLGYEYDFETHEARKLRWKPKNDELYYYINASCQIKHTVWYDDSGDNLYYNIGNCYKTEEEAKKRQEFYLSFKD